MAAAGLDRTSLRDELRTLWESIESLSFHYEDFAIDDRGRPEPAPAYATREDFRFAPPERIAKRAWFRDADGAWKSGNEMRLDGRRRVSLGFLEGQAEVLESVRISNIGAFGKAVVPLGGTGGFLWLPEGEPIHAWLDERAEVSAAAGEDRVEVRFSIPRGRTLSYTLERNRDWLPSRARLDLEAGQFVEYLVTEYQRDNGRWFFRAGRISAPDRDAGRGRRAFEFSDVKFNRGLDPESFTVPSRLEEGVTIRDQTKPRGDRVVGGIGALERFDRRYGLVPKASVGIPVGATPDAPSFPWPAVIGASSATALVAASFLSIRARFRSSPVAGDRP